MTKKSKIILSLASILVFASVIVWLNHSTILKYLLIKSVSSISHGQMVLSIGSVDYHPFKKNLKVLDLSLNTNDTLNSSNNSSSLQSLSFDSIVLNEFSLWNLLISRQIKADEVLTAKPNFVFNHKQAKDTAVSIKKQIKLISDLKINPLLKLDLGVLKIQYGRIEIKADSSDITYGSADFSMQFHQFNTVASIHQKNDTSFLFSKRIVFDISNVFRKLANGRILKIGNIEFDSKAENLRISKTELSSNSNGIIDRFFVKQLLLDGINLKEVGDLSNLKLKSISLDTAYIAVYPFRGNHAAKPQQQQILNEIKSVVGIFEVESISFKNINIEGFNNHGNRVLSLNKLGFSTARIRLDSNNIKSSLYPSLKGLQFVVNGINLDTILKLSSKKLAYNCDSATLKLFDLILKDDDSTNQIDCDILEINGFDVVRLLNKQRNDVSLVLNNTVFDINLDEKRADSAKLKVGIIEHMFLKQIKILNSNVFVNNEKGLELSAHNLNLGLDFNRDLALNSPIDFQKGDSIYFSSEKFNVRNTNDGYNFNANSISLNESDFHLYDVDFQISNTSDNEDYMRIKWDRLNLLDTDIFKLLYENELRAEGLIVENPDITFRVKSKLKSSNENPGFLILPFAVNISRLKISDGNFNLTIADSNSINLITKFNLKVKNIIQGNNFTFTDLAKLNFVSELVDFTFNDDKSSLHFKKVNYLSSDSTLTFSGLKLSISNFENQKLKSLNADLDIKTLSVENLQLLQLIKDKHLEFNNLEILEPNLKLEFAQKYNPTDSGNPNKLFVFKNLNITDLSADIKEFKDDDELNYKVGNADINWRPSKNNSKIEEFSLDLNDFSVHSIIKNFELGINKVKTKSMSDDISISGLEITKQPSDSTKGIKMIIPKLDIYDAVFNNFYKPELEVANLVADSLNLNIYESLKITKRNKIKPIDPSEIFGNSFSKFFITEVAFRNSGINIFKRENADSSSFHLDRFDVLIKNAGFKPNDSLVNIIDQISINLNENKHLIDSGLYILKSGLITYSFINNSLLIDTFSLIPGLEKDAFFKKAGFQTDMFFITGGKVKLIDFDLFSVLNEGKYILGSADIMNLDAKIYRDKKYDIKHGNPKPMPSEMLMLIKPQFYVGTVNVHDSRILYGEYVNKSNVPGEVYFDNFNLVATNVSNIDSLFNSNKNVEINLNTLVMGNSLLSARIIVPLDNSNTFSFSGKTDPMDFKIFNSMTENLFGVSVLRGTGSFDISGIYANDSLSNGKIKFKYNKLRIGLYDREKATLTKGIASPFFKFLVNDLLIKSNNPRTFGNTREGLVYFSRDTDRSFINYMWKSLLSGMLSTMWHNSKAQRKEKKRISKLKLSDN